MVVVPLTYPRGCCRRVINCSTTRALVNMDIPGRETVHCWSSVRSRVDWNSKHIFMIEMKCIVTPQCLVQSALQNTCKMHSGIHYAMIFFITNLMEISFSSYPNSHIAITTKIFTWRLCCVGTCKNLLPSNYQDINFSEINFAMEKKKWKIEFHISKKLSNTAMTVPWSIGSVTSKTDKIPSA